MVDQDTRDEVDYYYKNNPSRPKAKRQYKKPIGPKPYEVTRQYAEPIGPEKPFARPVIQYDKPIGPEKPKRKPVSEKEYNRQMKSAEGSYAEDAAYSRGDIIDLDKKPDRFGRAVSYGKDLLFGKPKAEVFKPAPRQPRKGRGKGRPPGEPRYKTWYRREGGVMGAFQGVQGVAAKLPRHDFEEMTSLPMPDFGFQFGPSNEPAAPRGRGGKKAQKLPNFGFDFGFD